MKQLPGIEWKILSPKLDESLHSGGPQGPAETLWLWPTAHLRGQDPPLLVLPRSGGPAAEASDWQPPPWSTP